MGKALALLRDLVAPAGPSRALTLLPPLRAIQRTESGHAVLPVPPRAPPSAQEVEIARTGAFVIEGEVTNWTRQPGQMSGSVDVVDNALNAAMGSFGGANVTLKLPVALMRHLPPEARVEIVVRVIS